MSARAQVPVDDVPALLRRAARGGDRAALSFYRGKTLAGRLTYAELSARVEVFAGALHARFGVRPGDAVAILSPNRLEVPVAVLALLRLGALVVPLNPASAPTDWEYVLGHSFATGLISTGALAQRLPLGARPGFTLLLEEALPEVGAAPPPSADLSEATAVVLYTSGTTGQPKGVALRQRNLLANARSMAENFELREATQLAVLPLYHAHAFGFGLMTALCTGGHLVFTERLEPFTWAEVIRKERVSVTSVVPTLLPMLLAAGVSAEQVPSLRHILVSSAPLPTALAREVERKLRVPLIQGWGLSEYTNFACCSSPTASSEVSARLMFGFEVPSIGPALHGTEVRVLGESGAEATEGMRGELVVRGHSTMAGYFRDPLETSRALDEDGWLHTGDQGFFQLEHGEPVYFVTGRLKEIIIRDAEKYSPLGLERRLLEAVPSLTARLVVLGFPHQDHGEEVGAYIETPALEEATRAELGVALGAMPLAERPKVVLYGAQPIPRTHTGKIQRRKMQAWLAAWVRHRGGVVVEALGPGAAPPEEVPPEASSR